MAVLYARVLSPLAMRVEIVAEGEIITSAQSRERVRVGHRQAVIEGNVLYLTQRTWDVLRQTAQPGPPSSPGEP